MRGFCNNECNAKQQTDEGTKLFNETQSNVPINRLGDAKGVVWVLGAGNRGRYTVIPLWIYLLRILFGCRLIWMERLGINEKNGDLLWNGQGIRSG
jgi:hypothetical protein